MKEKFPRKLVLLLHGLGSSGEDMMSFVPTVQPSMPDVHFVAPNGIEVCDTYPSGFQWFSFKDVDLAILKSEIRRTAPQIRAMINEYLQESGLGYRDLIIVGFSQGGMVGIDIALTATGDENLPLGVVVFSGALLEPNHISNTSTPICMIYGDYDDVLDPKFMRQSSAKLRELGVSVEEHVIPGLGHSIDERAMQYAIDFIKSLI